MNGKDLEKRMIIGLQELSKDIEKGIVPGKEVLDYLNKQRSFRFQFMDNYSLFDLKQKQNIIYAIDTVKAVMVDEIDRMQAHDYLEEMNLL